VVKANNRRWYGGVLTGERPGAVVADRTARDEHPGLGPPIRWPDWCEVTCQVTVTVSAVGGCAAVGAGTPSGPATKAAPASRTSLPRRTHDRLPSLSFLMRPSWLKSAEARGLPLPGAYETTVRPMVHPQEVIPATYPCRSAHVHRGSERPARQAPIVGSY